MAAFSRRGSGGGADLLRRNGVALKAGEGLAVRDEPELTISSKDSGEILLFDLAG